MRSWGVVSGAALLALIPSSPALGLYSQGYFLGPMTAEFGWSRTEFMSAVSIGYLALAFLNPIVGHAGDRFGVRPLLLVGVPLYAVVLLLLATLGGDLALYRSLTIAGILLSIFQTPLLYAKAIASWTQRDRGIALAIGLSGVAVGNMILPPLTAWTIEAYGWRGGRVAQGLLVLLLAVPAIALFVREPARRAPPAGRAPAGRLVLGALLRDRTFLLLGAAFALSGMALNGSLAHFVPLLQSNGIPVAVATACLSMMAAAQLIGRLATGFFLDRVQSPKIGLVWFALAALGLTLVELASGLPLLVPAAIMIGLALGSEVELAAYYSARFFGMARFGEIYGFVTATYGIGSALGGLVLGLSYDRTGSYAGAMMFVIAMVAISCVAVLLLPPYGYTREGKMV